MTIDPQAQAFSSGSRPQASRNGVILLILLTFIILTLIIFASVMNRVRNESALTARNSINELMYQLAVSVGELAVRRIGRDFELNAVDAKNEKMQEKIFKLIQNPPATPEKTNCTSLISGLDVVKELTEKHFKQNSLKFEVTYSIEIHPFDPKRFQQFDGLPSAKYDREGELKVTVDVYYTHGKTYKKSYVVSKPFMVMFLLPAPFHRFTLFATQGAGIDPKTANASRFDDNGVLQSGGKTPMVFLNRPITANSATLEFATHRSNFIPNQDALFKSGWIYLGGKGYNNNPDGLVLNVAAGAQSDNAMPPSKAYGEFFHFFTDNQTKGWIPNSWWSQNYPAIFSQSNNVYAMFVDYGHFFSMYEPSQSLYQNIFSLRVANYTKGPDLLKFGSSLHLFGTPRYCTPTLVFGNIRRRYMRTHALLSVPPSVPFVVKSAYLAPNVTGSLIQDFVTSVSNQTGGTGLNLSARAKQVNDWFLDPTTFNPLVPPDRLRGLGPMIIDDEPYLLALGNLCYPDQPAQGQNIQSIFAKSGLNRLEPFFGNDPKKITICAEDPDVPPDNETGFKGGKWSRLRLNCCGVCNTPLPTTPPTGGGSMHRCNKAGCKGARFLRNKASYYVTEAIGGTDMVSWKALAKTDFMKRFFTDDGELYLNQILVIKHKLVIDEPLTVMRGGAILCDNDIEVNASIRCAQPQTGNYMPFVTLVTNKNITLNTNHVEAFLVASNGSTSEVRNNCGNPIFIRGGVTCDVIDGLVKNGGTIMYGLDPADLGGGGNATEQDNPEFYGFAFGPKTQEDLVDGP